ncbi:unnamed protein product [Kuraishia capsulata CBS 1993]|uniref:Uncharacterized protein n=1 Tax=Kuraishia capsulata CBS 1993 TaxID=1382522 RepID=W6MHA6_9ASCO|nr:uncharacterized protein KUCA_T00000985001 [Kuraishia capsulata CBS 1993]CDK25018.1 unnamed protein product [Kuraishia capsulata CBS 1993]
MSLNVRNTLSLMSASTRSTIILGCLVGVLSSACQSVGLILQRKSHLIQQTKSHYKPPYKRSLWRLGFTLFIVANVFGSSIQITTLPLIVLSPLQSIGLVFNACFSSLILNEPFTVYSLFGTLVISIGAFLIASFGAIPEPEYTLDDFMVLLRRKPFVIWASLDAVLVCVFLGWIVVMKNLDQAEHDDNFGHFHLTSPVRVSKNSRGETEEQDPLLSRVTSVTSQGSSTVSGMEQNDMYRQVLFASGMRSVDRFAPLYSTYFAKLKDKISLLKGGCRALLFDMSHESSMMMQGALFGVVSGIMSAHSLLLAKSVIEILVNAFNAGSVHAMLKILNHLESWFIIGGFLTLCLTQLWFLNKGLKRVSTSILYPLVFCIYNIVNICNGMIFYKQWGSVTYVQLFNIIIGTILVLGGVFALSWRLDDAVCADPKTPTLQCTTTFASPGYGSTNLVSPMDPTSPRSVRSSSAKTKWYSNRAFLRNSVGSIQDHINTSKMENTSLIDYTPGVEPESYSSLAEVVARRKSLKNNERTSRNIPNLSIDTHQQSLEEGLSEYVSFGSPKDTSSFTQDADSNITPIINAGSLQSGKALLTPLSKYKPQWDKTPTKSGRSDTGFSLAQLSPFRAFSSSKTDPDISSSTARDVDSKPHAPDNDLENRALMNEDYNSRNPFSYSMNNTMEEIHHQIIANNYGPGQPTPGVPSINEGQVAARANLSEDLGSSVDINRKSISSISGTRHQSEFKPSENWPSKTHGRRVLSFEQNELLSQLRLN